jgi:hypothetical protein
VTCFFRRGSLKHLGTLYGHGSLLTKDGAATLGPVTYEIDGYLAGGSRTANGQIEGARDILKQAFAERAAFVALTGGRRIHVILSDPQGGSVAEVEVSGAFPL